MNHIQKEPNHAKLRWPIASGALLLIIAITLGIILSSPETDPISQPLPPLDTTQTTEADSNSPTDQPITPQPTQQDPAPDPVTTSPTPSETAQKSDMWRTRNANIMLAGKTQLDTIGTHDDPLQDLETIHDIFASYLITLKTDRGLPTGTHQEIVAALRGNNPRNFEFIPPEHPQYDRQGRITDRWDTPFFFHAVSSFDMQVISAGPDRELWTDDDLVYPPPENY